jgi:hypothetical protein
MNGMDQILRGYQTGAGAEWAAQAQKWIQYYDPDGKILGHTSQGENYDQLAKDAAQLTAARLSQMSQNAPASEASLLNEFAVTADKSPAALRDLLIRQRATMEQQHDYYNGFDPYNNKNGENIIGYNRRFYNESPYDKYRTKYESRTPNYAGEHTPGVGGNGTPTASGGLPVFNSPDDVRKAKLPPGTPFMTSDGRRLIAP